MSSNPITATDPTETRRRVRCNTFGDLFVELTNPSGESQTDEITGALATIDIVHHEVHEGELFSLSYKSPDASPIADNATIIFVMITGNKYCHLIADAAMGGDAQIEFREGVTITGGTVIAPRNHKREGAVDVTTVAAVRDPTINNAGTLLEDIFLPGGTGGNAVGIQGGQREEWILARNTRYMLRLTNRAGNAQPGSLRVTWYEETDN